MRVRNYLNFFVYFFYECFADEGSARASPMIFMGASQVYDEESSLQVALDRGRRKSHLDEAMQKNLQSRRPSLYAHFATESRPKSRNSSRRGSLLA